MTSIYVFPVTDLHNAHNKYVGLDFVENTVDSAPQAILLGAGQLLGLWWARVFGQFSNGGDDPLGIAFWDGVKILGYRLAEADIISFHGA